MWRRPAALLVPAGSPLLAEDAEAGQVGLLSLRGTVCVLDPRAFSERLLAERGRAWSICEGFQFILKVQADALLTLGVCQDFKVGASVSQAQEEGPAVDPR